MPAWWEQSQQQRLPSPQPAALPAMDAPTTDIPLEPWLADFIATPAEGAALPTPPSVKDKPGFSLSNLPGAIWDAGRGLVNTLPASGYRAYYGTDRPDTQSESARAAYQQEAAFNQEMADKTAAAQAAGVSDSTSESIREAGKSLGFTGISMGATALGGLGGGAVGSLASPVVGTAAGIGAGMAASGKLAYNMAANQLLTDAFDQLEAKSLKEQGRGMTEQEKQAAYDELLPVAQNTGLWEAGPEAIGNALTLGAGKFIFSRLGPEAIKSIAGRAGMLLGKPAEQLIAKGGAPLLKGGAVAGSVAQELGMEGWTQQNQGNDQAMVDAYLSGLPMSEAAQPYADGLPGWWQGVKDVAPVVLATMGLMGGSAAVGNQIYRRVAGQPEASQGLPSPDTQPIEETSQPILGGIVPTPLPEGEDPMGAWIRQQSEQQDYVNQQRPPIPILDEALNGGNPDPVAAELEQLGFPSPAPAQPGLPTSPTPTPDPVAPVAPRAVEKAALQNELAALNQNPAQPVAPVAPAPRRQLGQGPMEAPATPLGMPQGQAEPSGLVRPGDELNRLLGPSPVLPAASGQAAAPTKQNLNDLLTRPASNAVAPGPMTAQGSIAPTVAPAPPAEEIKARQGKKSDELAITDTQLFPEAANLPNQSLTELEAISQRLDAWLATHSETGALVLYPDGGLRRTIIPYRNTDPIKRYQQALDDALSQVRQAAARAPKPSSSPAAPNPAVAAREARRIESMVAERTAEVAALIKGVKAKQEAIRQQALGMKDDPAMDRELVKSLGQQFREGNEHLFWLENKAFLAQDAAGGSVNLRASNAALSSIPDTIKAYAAPASPPTPPIAAVPSTPLPENQDDSRRQEAETEALLNPEPPADTSAGDFIASRPKGLQKIAAKALQSGVEGYDGFTRADLIRQAIAGGATVTKTAKGRTLGAFTEKQLTKHGMDYAESLNQSSGKVKQDTDDKFYRQLLRIQQLYPDLSPRIQEHRARLLEKARKHDEKRASDFAMQDVTPSGYGPTDPNSESYDPHAIQLSTEQKKLQASINEAKTILRGNISGEKRKATKESLKRSQKKLEEENIQQSISAKSESVGSNRPADIAIAAGQNQMFATAKSKPKAAKDADYLAAVERGDMETAQRMVNEAAEAAGYQPTGHRMDHRAPDRENVNLMDVLESNLVPEDYWTHPQWYQSAPGEMESWRKIKDALDRAKRLKESGKTTVPRITVYRAVPKSIKESLARNGDWVTPSEADARLEGGMIDGGYKIITLTVPINRLWWDGNSINELGYDDGNEYGYKNTKNNRKLIDAVTYDDDGNVIPLSKRFKSNNEDQRYAQQATPASLAAQLKALSSDATVDALRNNGRLKLVAKQSELPPHAAIPPGQRVAGWVDPKTGVVYLVTDNITQEEVDGLLKHEIGVHQTQLGLNRTKAPALKLAHALVRLLGGRAILGNPAFEQVLAQLEQMRAAGNTRVVAAFKEAENAAGKLNQSPELLAEEALAYLVQNQPQLPLVRRIMAAIRAMLYKMGLKIDLNEADLQALAQSAVRRAAGRPALRPSVAATAMQRAAQAPQDVEAQRQFNDVVVKYKGTPQWMKAPNGEPTKLTERQWIQAQTENFKKWFDGSQVKDANGDPLVVYHGTDGNFNIFEPHSMEPVYRADGQEIQKANSWDYGDDAQGMPEAYHYGAISDVLMLGAEEALKVRQADFARYPSASGQRHLRDIQRLKGKKLTVSDESKPSGDGSYFTPDKDYSFIKNIGVRENGNVMPVFLNIKNPAWVNASEVESAGRSWKADKYREQGYDGAIYADNRQNLEQPGWASATQIATFSPNQIKSAISNVGTFGETADIRYARAQGQANPAMTADEVLAMIGAGQNGAAITDDELAFVQAYLSSATSALTAQGVDAPSFKSWFGASKIVNKAGKPLKMYHGTAAQFTVFDADRAGANTTHPTAAMGFFFTNDRDHAAAKYGADVMEVYLAIERPYLMTDADLRRIDDRDEAVAFRARLEGLGYDGIVLPREAGSTRYVAAFYPDQIKLTNNETYTRGEEDVRFSYVGENAKTADQSLLQQAKAGIADSDVIVNAGGTRQQFAMAGEKAMRAKKPTEPMVYHQTSKQFLQRIAAEGMTAGSFSDKPIAFMGDVWLAVAKKDLHEKTQVQTYGNATSYEPAWRTKELNDDLEWVETDQSISPDKIWIANKAGNLVMPLTQYIADQQLPQRFAIARPRPAPGAPPQVAPPAMTRVEMMQRAIQDKFLRFKTIQNWLKQIGINLTPAADVYGAEERSVKRFAAKAEDFRKQTVRPLVQAASKAGYRVTGGDLIGALLDGQLLPTAFKPSIPEYLIARHAPKRNASIAKVNPVYATPDKPGSGLTDAQAAAIVAKYQAMPGFAEFAQQAEQFRKISEDTKKMMLSAGLLSADQVAAWDAAYGDTYVPLMGGPEDAPGSQGTGPGQSVNARQHRALGHGLREENVIENIFRARERALFLIEKNQVGLALRELLLQANNTELGTVSQPEKKAVLAQGWVHEVWIDGRPLGAYSSYNDAKAAIAADSATTGRPVKDYGVRHKASDPGVIYMTPSQLADNEATVYINGERVRMQINDPDAARAYNALGVDAATGLIKAGAAFNSYLSKAYTGFNPEFLAVNIARDLTAGLINLTGKYGVGFAAKALKHYPAAMRETWRYARDKGNHAWVDRYRAAGGSTGAAYLTDLERLGTDLTQAFQDAQGAATVWKEGKKGAALRVASADMIQWAFGLIEKMNMVGENAMRVATFRAVIEAGGTDAEAASAAANVTVNFNRRGEMGQQLSALYLFFNPNVQGTQVLLDTLLNSPHKAQAWAAAGALAGLAFALAGLARGGDDEDEKKWRTIPAHVKDRNMILKMGDAQVTIPVPFGYGAFWSLGNILSDLAHGADEGKAGYRLASALFQHFSPIGNPLAGDEADFKGVGQILPTVARMPMEVALNRSGLGAPIRPETPAWNPGQPDSQSKWRSSTGNLYDRFSVGMNRLTGGSAYESGFMDASPETWKTIVRDLTGGAGQFVADSLNLGLTVLQGAVPTLKELPILRKFVREETIQDARAYFHSQAQQVKIAVGAFNAAKRAKDGAGAMDVVHDKAELIRMGSVLNSANKLIQARRMAQQQILAGDDPLPVKREQLKTLEAQEAAIYDRFDAIFIGATARRQGRIGGS